MVPAAQSRRRRLNPTLVAVAVAAAVVGVFVGGYLEFAAWDVNVFDRLIIRALALLIVSVLALMGWRSAGPVRVLAVASGALFVGSLVGGWVAPSANPPSWSRGTLRLELGDPVNAVVEGPSECDSGALRLVVAPFFTNWVTISAPGIDSDFDAGLGPISGERLSVSLAFRTEEAMTGDLPFSAERHLDIYSSSPSQVRHGWSYDGEDQSQMLEGNGSPQRGTATFSRVGQSVDWAGGGLGQIAPFALSGRIDWTCEPPRGVPTVREGTWFR